MRLQSAPSSILTNHFRASHASPASQHKGGNSKPAFADMPAEAAAGAMSPPSQKSLVIQDPVYGPHSITEVKPSEIKR